MRGIFFDMTPQSSLLTNSAQTTALFMFSAKTAGEKNFFGNRHRVRFLYDTLTQLSEEYGWELHAWVVVPNEYAFIASAGAEDARNRARFIKHLQVCTESFVNVLDNRRGRRVWQQAKCEPTSEWASFAHCVEDVHALPVLKGVCQDAAQYPWSSAAELKQKVG